MTVTTPDEVLKHSKATRDFLCPINANTYGIEFLAFNIRDYETKEMLFDVTGSDTTTGSMEIDVDYNNSPMTEDSFRKIKYTFSERVLKLPLISTALTFKVGNEALSNFRMIERHYFRNKLVKSFDFTFGFCIPGSTNTWEAVYNIPTLDDELIEDMIRHPFETKSDSFYFVGDDDELVMHNRASYNYVASDVEARNQRLNRLTPGVKSNTPGSDAEAKEDRSLVRDWDNDEMKSSENEETKSLNFRGRNDVDYDDGEDEDDSNNNNGFDEHKRRQADDKCLSRAFDEAKITSPDDSSAESKDYTGTRNATNDHWTKETDFKENC